MRSVNSKSFIYGSEFIISSLQRMNLYPNMELLLFTVHTQYQYVLNDDD